MPKPVAVETDAEGRPSAVTLQSRRLRVLQVQDAWRIDDEWWRERPVSRLYFELALENGQVVMTFRDLAGKRWWAQNY